MRRGKNPYKQRRKVNAPDATSVPSPWAEISRDQ